MTKRTIKIVKRDAEQTPEPVPTAEQSKVQLQKDAADDERDMVDSVKGWITERVENSKAEGLRSESERRSWNEKQSREPR